MHVYELSFCQTATESENDALSQRQRGWVFLGNLGSQINCIMQDLLLLLLLRCVSASALLSEWSLQALEPPLTVNTSFFGAPPAAQRQGSSRSTLRREPVATSRSLELDVGGAVFVDASLCLNSLRRLHHVELRTADGDSLSGLRLLLLRPTSIAGDFKGSALPADPNIQKNAKVNHQTLDYF